MAVTWTIAGAAKSLKIGWSITETANGRNRLSASVISTDGSYIPAINAEVIGTEDGTRIFGGNLTNLTIGGAGGFGLTPLETRFDASDFNALADRRVAIDLTFTAGSTIKTCLTTLVTDYLDDYGVTLDGAQVNGPNLETDISVQTRTVREWLDDLALVSGYQWEIDYNKVLRMTQPGTVAAPIDVVDGDGHAIYDIEVEPARNDFANYIILLAGTGTKQLVDVVGTADGAEDTWTLHYTPASFFGYINLGGTVANEWVTGGVNETLGTAPASWSYDASTNSITRVAGAPGGAAGDIIVPMMAQFPFRVIATTSPPPAAADRVDRVIVREDIFDWETATALAADYLARANDESSKVTYTTLSTGLHPGQTQTITIATRDINATYLISDVTITNIAGGVVTRTVTAVEGTTLGESWRDTVRSWSGTTMISSGSGAPSSPATVGAAPPDGAVQFNDSGAFGGDAQFTYNPTTDSLVCGGGGSSITASLPDSCQVFGYNCHITD